MLEFDKLSQILLIDIFNDFKENYAGKTLKVKTNFKLLSSFEVKFFENNLPHLLGLHYVSKEKSGDRILNLVKSGDLTLESIRKHPAYNAYDIPKRILCYPFLHEVFFAHKIKIVIPTEQLQNQKNPLKLTCVFTHARNNGEVVLGLRRHLVDGYFVPTTL
jgi:hypothetical protein